MAQSPLPHRSRRRPSLESRARHADDGSDSDSPAPPNPRIRPSRAVRRVETYRESSDESPAQASTVESEASSEEVFLCRGTRSRPARSEESVHSSHTKPKFTSTGRQAPAGSFSSYKRRKIQTSNVQFKPAAHSEIITPSPTSNQRFLPWQQLPYEVLASIMKYAAYPLYGQASRSNPSINWLCSTSLLCRSFHEACMAALLYRPPLYPAWRAHGLMRLLKEDPATLVTDYKRKIHYLDIEVKQLLLRKSGISLDDLLSHTPLVQGIRLYSNHDDYNTLIWAQPTAQRLNWSYPPQIFERLDKDNIKMRSFEWNGRFPTALETLETATRVHANSSFSHLRHLAFLNLTLPEKTSEADVVKAHSLLAGALNRLGELTSLSFRNCAVLDDVATMTLPIGLQDLEFSHCSRLTSEDLEQYLRLGGSSLRTLKLFGNQSMSLGFMAGFRQSCPRLQTLEVDMLYIDPTSYRDRDPLYDELLPSGPPSWPTDLVTVSVENLRQLSAADAEEFFASLVDSSEHLPYLRTLNIKAILKGAGWRDRARLRKTWLARLQDVFLSSAEPFVTKISSNTSPTVSQRQSSRIANTQFKKSSIRMNAYERDATAPNPVQPRCEIVNLVISDQRPAQDQFHEDDFLDDEPSDDGEWNGRDTETLSTGYAW
ncbi:hypothetical protein A1O1_01733 [Capronia coronata CBS 617.96]|uniref:F-box domain-containing protein n=1 Tax=Capronia coronata CBS 617.96 TaxID=1182541 RepID=W9YVS2_9EURO|nr:uncharacterized protein A1O1_01733 [Capronia coronata CBS 617.96]EXJ93341.1 hypothetical protein A1O1_01733 [Capronia coronata CBS 617.96]